MEPWTKRFAVRIAFVSIASLFLGIEYGLPILMGTFFLGFAVVFDPPIKDE